MSRLPFSRARHGGVGVLSALIVTALAGIGALALNLAHIHYVGLLQRQTTQAAALAAAAKLSSYYVSGTNSSTAIVAAAQTIAQANMPTATYGTVVPAGNVVRIRSNAVCRASSWPFTCETMCMT